MAISIVYLTYLCQDVLYDMNSSGGNRAAAAGAIILIIMQVSCSLFFIQLIPFW